MTTQSTDPKSRKRIHPRTIAIIALAVVVVLEGAFLLLHHPKADADAPTNAAAERLTPEPDGTGVDETEAPATPDGAEETDAPEESPSAQDNATAAPGSTAQPSASAQPTAQPNSGSGTNGSTVPAANAGKAYAAAVQQLADYAASPSTETLASVLGGALLGDEMQRFLPALLTLSGQTAEDLETELNAALALPANTASLTITGEQPLSTAQINEYSATLRTMEKDFNALSGELSNYEALTDADWASVGSQMGVSGAEAKRLMTQMSVSAAAMEKTLADIDITEAYQVTLKANTGATMQTNVFCIGGKWVTEAFFQIEFD